MQGYLEESVGRSYSNKGRIIGLFWHLLERTETCIWWWAQSYANPSLVFEFPFTGKITVNSSKTSPHLAAITPVSKL